MTQDKMINELLGFFNKNHRNLLALIEVVKKDLVVPFVGAGMSVPIYPVWKEFLSEMLGNDSIRPSAKEQISKLIYSGKYEQAASVLQKELGKAEFISDIKHMFSDEKITREKYEDMAISLIPHIFKNNTVITTNFDRLLNRVYEETGYPFKGSLAPYEPSDVVKGDFQQNLLNYLLKLHGDYLHTDKIAFAEEQYDNYYGKKLDSEYVAFIANALSQRVLLFLGCSLETDRTMMLLEKIALNQHRTHYAVVESTSDSFDDDGFHEKRKRLSDMGILCIWYPKGKHEFVKVILQEIKRCTKKNNPHNMIGFFEATVKGKPREYFENFDRVGKIHKDLDKPLGTKTDNRLISDKIDEINKSIIELTGEMRKVIIHSSSATDIEIGYDEGKIAEISTRNNQVSTEEMYNFSFHISAERNDNAITSTTANLMQSWFNLHQSRNFSITISDERVNSFNNRFNELDKMIKADMLVSTFVKTNYGECVRVLNKLKTENELKRLAIEYYLADEFVKGCLRISKVGQLEEIILLILQFPYHDRHKINNSSQNILMPIFLNSTVVDIPNFFIASINKEQIESFVSKSRVFTIKHNVTELSYACLKQIIVYYYFYLAELNLFYDFDVSSNKESLSFSQFFVSLH